VVHVALAVITIKLYIDATRGIEISHELEAKGYTRGIEYDFAYHLTQWDPVTSHKTDEKHVLFTFHDACESLASWFSLRYA
jgi:DNA-binding MltR family transcriptional regulator